MLSHILSGETSRRVLNLLKIDLFHFVMMLFLLFFLFVFFYPPRRFACELYQKFLLHWYRDWCVGGFSLSATMVRDVRPSKKKRKTLIKQFELQRGWRLIRTRLTINTRYLYAPLIVLADKHLPYITFQVTSSLNPNQFTVRLNCYVQRTGAPR